MSRSKMPLTFSLTRWNRKTRIILPCVNIRNISLLPEKQRSRSLFPVLPDWLLLTLKKSGKLPCMTNWIWICWGMNGPLFSLLWVIRTEPLHFWSVWSIPFCLTACASGRMMCMGAGFPSMYAAWSTRRQISGRFRIWNVLWRPSEAVRSLPAWCCRRKASSKPCIKTTWTPSSVTVTPPFS